MATILRNIGRSPRDNLRTRRALQHLKLSEFDIPTTGPIQLVNGVLTLVIADGEPLTDDSAGLALATGDGLEVADVSGVNTLQVALSGDQSLEFVDGGLQAKLAPSGGIGTSPDGLLVVGGIPITTEIPAGTIDGENAEFTLTDVPDEGVALLFVNGLLMMEGEGNDYQREGGAITYETGAVPQVGDVHIAVYLTGPDAAGESPVGAINGTNAVFTLANKPVASSLLLFLNGVLMLQGAGADYTLDDDTITYNAGSEPQSGDQHYAVYQKDTSDS